MMFRVAVSLADDCAEKALTLMCADDATIVIILCAISRWLEWQSVIALSS